MNILREKILVCLEHDLPGLQPGPSLLVHCIDRRGALTLGANDENYTHLLPLIHVDAHKCKQNH